MGNSIDMKKFNELQKKIKEWTSKTIKSKEKAELQLNQVNGAIELIKNKYSSVLKKDNYTALHSMLSEGESEAEKLKRNIKDYTKQLNLNN